MILSRLQLRRFFSLFDKLTLYANACLDVVDEDELHEAGIRGINDRAQAKISYELWQNLQVIDSYVRDNPDGLTAGELDIVASWRKGLTDTFLVDFFPDGEIRFISSGYAFEVTGLSKEIASMIEALPAAVRTTLLPFDGNIVYAEYLGNYLIEFGDGILGTFEHEIHHLHEEGRIVRTADDLVRVADEIRETTLSRDTEKLIADLERGLFDADDDLDHLDELDDDDDFDAADYVQHRGALADVAYEDRQKAIFDYMDKEDLATKSNLVELLDGRCTDGPITANMVELLATEDAFDVRRFAKLIDFDGMRDLEGPALIDGIVAHIGDDGALSGIVGDLTTWSIQSLRELSDRGGRWAVAADDIKSLRDLPSHEVGLSYVFHEGDDFTFVMPDEVLAAAQTLDWDAALAKANAYRQLIELIDKQAELRGILTIEDAIAEYERCYPDGFKGEDEILPLLMQGIVEGVANFDMIETESRDVYVLHYELFWEYEDEMGIEHATFASEPVTLGELGEMLEGLLARQRGKDPRPLTPEMLATRSLFDWKMEQGAVRAFCQYLDAHVPAARNDYYFADRVIEELVDDAKWGIPDKGAQRLFDILENNDFIPEANQIQKVLDLWQNLSNALPVWPNNGWSPNELLQADLGHPVFYNEDGSFMKVGRNDPCPCGSGLKYKKCCGR